MTVRLDTQVTILVATEAQATEIEDALSCGPVYVDVPIGVARYRAALCPTRRKDSEDVAAGLLAPPCA